MVELVARVRKLDVVAQVVSLVLTAGSDDSGRQADAYSQYLEEAGKPVVRRAFYAWFTETLALLMISLAREAMEKVWVLPPVLTGDLVGVEDWLLVDSETVTLPDELSEDFPATSTAWDRQHQARRTHPARVAHPRSSDPRGAHEGGALASETREGPLRATFLLCWGS